MSVQRFNLIPSQSGRIGHESEREYQDTYHVRVSDYRDNQLTIWSHRQCPKKGDRHPFDNQCVVDEIDCNRIGNSKFHWEVIVKYTSIKTENQDETNPLKEVPEIELKTQSYMEDAYVDIYGNPLVNTAGDPILGIQVERFNWKIMAKLNISPDFPSWILDCGGRINSSMVRIRGLSFPKETLRLRDISIGKIDSKNDIKYSELHLEMEYDERTHRKRPLNVGYTQLSPELFQVIDNKQVPYREKILINGEPPTDPVFLNKKGQRIHEMKKIRGSLRAVYKDTITAKDVIVLEFEVYDKLNFRVFGLN